MKRTPSYKALLKQFNAYSTELKNYFSQFPALIQNHPYEVCLAYLFLRTEMAQNRTLYCGVVKLHHAHTEIAQNAVDVQHLTRDGFLELYQKIFGEALPDGIASRLKQAEKIRDKVVHGKAVYDPEIREAMCDVVDYASQMNSYLQAKAGFQPFADLRGFKGRAI